MPATIEWLLQQKKLGEFSLLAGEKGRQNCITGVNIMDNPDTVRWLQPGELILTTGYLFLEDARLRNKIVAELAKRGCSGIGFVLKRYFDALPPEIKKKADALGFPVLSVPYELSLAEVGWMIYRYIFAESMSETERLIAVYKRFAEDLGRGNNIADMAADVVRVLQCPALVLDDELNLAGYDLADCQELADAFSPLEGSPVFSRQIARSIADAVRRKKPLQIKQAIGCGAHTARLSFFHSMTKKMCLVI